MDTLHTDAQLPEFAPKCVELRDQEPDQVIVDLIWPRIGKYLSDAAGKAIGRLQFHTHTSAEFWTEELQEDREEANTLQEAFQEEILSLHPQAWLAYQWTADHMKLYREKLKQRATTLYQDHIYDWGDHRTQQHFSIQSKEPGSG